MTGAKGFLRKINHLKIIDLISFRSGPRRVEKDVKMKVEPIMCMKTKGRMTICPIEMPASLRREQTPFFTEKCRWRTFTQYRVLLYLLPPDATFMMAGGVSV